MVFPGFLGMKDYPKTRKSEWEVVFVGSAQKLPFFSTKKNTKNMEIASITFEPYVGFC